ncbi:MAG: hypothetical protein HYV09_28350 [Deltaproteobacteria bacterium]|nr:hypothetical protein [Deltaproteobacteria bacterium]
MFKRFLSMLGLRRAQPSFFRRRGALLAPIGGLIPAIAWLAWHNRAELKSAYGRYFTPRLHRGRGATEGGFQAAAI